MPHPGAGNGGKVHRGLSSVFPLVVLFALAWTPSGGEAADARLGRAKAVTACTVCHGPLGISTAPNTPHLAGQPAQYLEDQLKKYREGTRRHEIMTLIAKPLTDGEIADLAAWFESVRIEASPGQ